MEAVLVQFGPALQQFIHAVAGQQEGRKRCDVADVEQTAARNQRDERIVVAEQADQRVDRLRPSKPDEERSQLVQLRLAGASRELCVPGGSGRSLFAHLRHDGVDRAFVTALDERLQRQVPDVEAGVGQAGDEGIRVRVAGRGNLLEGSQTLVRIARFQTNTERNQSHGFQLIQERRAVAAPGIPDYSIGLSGANESSIHPV